MKWFRLGLLVTNLVLLNLLLLRSGIQWDATKEKIHTLSPEIPEILKRLPTTAKVFFVASENKQAAALKPLVGQIKDILRHFKESSPQNFEIEFIDPYQDPQKRNYVESHFGVIRFPAETADGGRSEVYFSVVVQVGSQSEVLMQNLVRPTPEGTNELNNFESLLVRTLNKLSRRHQTLHQTLIQAGSTGKLRMMPVISETLDPRFIRTKALIEGVVEDMIDTYPDIRKEAADLADEKFVETLRRGSMRPIQLPEQEPFWCHLLIIRPDGSSVEVPDLFRLQTAQGMRQHIEQYLLLLLDQGGRQLGLLIPGPTDERGQPRQTGYEILPTFFQQDFQVHRLEMPVHTIPPGIETLMVMGIDRADADTVREVDKFLMRGGRLILFADRHVFGMPERVATLFPVESGFEPMIKQWGLELGTEVGVGPGVEMGWQKKSISGRHENFDLETVRSPYTPIVPASETHEALPLAGIDGVMLSHPNVIHLDQTRNLKITSLLKGGANSWGAVTADHVNPFDEDGKYVVPQKKKWDKENPLYGVLLEGSFPHYETPGVTEDFVRVQSVDTRVAFIADGDFLDFNFWAPRWRGRQTQEVDSRFNDNTLFLRNLVDWAFGDDDVLKVGSRISRVRVLSAEAKLENTKNRHALWALGSPAVFLLLVGLWRWRRRVRA